MPPRDWRLRIEDRLDAVDAITGFVENTDLEAFRQDQKTVDAVVRNLEVIGEAARFVPKDVRQRFPEVPWENIAVWGDYESSAGFVWSSRRRVI